MVAEDRARGAPYKYLASTAVHQKGLVTVLDVHVSIENAISATKNLV